LVGIFRRWISDNRLGVVFFLPAFWLHNSLYK
jgi:hypothetical protein